MKINKIPDQSVEIYTEENGEMVFFGLCQNEYSFLDLRVQIKQEQLENVFIKIDSGYYIIDKDGRLPIWPPDLYPMQDYYLRLILH